jgi:hypothetical protein
MMYHWMRGFTTTVNLSEEAFWDMYYRLESVRQEIEKATKAAGSRTLLPSLEIYGKIYPRDQVYEALAGFNQYIENSGASSSEYDALKAKLHGLESIFYSLETMGQLKKVHTPSMEFKVW